MLSSKWFTLWCLKLQLFLTKIEVPNGGRKVHVRIHIIWAAQPGLNGRLSCLHSFKIFHSQISSTRDVGSKCIVTTWFIHIVEFKTAIVSNQNWGTPKIVTISFVKISESHGMLLTAQLHERWRKQAHCDRLCFRVCYEQNCGVSDYKSLAILRPLGFNFFCKIFT